MKEMMQLENDSRVVIVGGGPAGCFTAINLLRLAAQAGKTLQVEIFEPRDFNKPGPGGCNKCAGLLSSKLVNYLSEIDLEVPDHLILAKLNGYVLHLGKSELFVQVPNNEKPILSVYRGSGPRIGSQPPPNSFDAWLLEKAQERGAILYPERVRSVCQGPRPVIASARRSVEADLVVIATGINSRSPLEASWGYRPPRTEIMAQNEVPLPAGIFHSHVHVFFEPPDDLVFGAFIPKGQYANVSLLGYGLDKDAVKDFLSAHQSLVPGPPDLQMLCGCKPNVAVSPSAGYFADRMVAVGDSAVSRLYKDGLGSAFITAEKASKTAVKLGVSKADFTEGYLPTCRQIAVDNLFGHLLFFFWARLHNAPIIYNSLQHTLAKEEFLPVQKQVFRRILWGLFTGEESYRRIFRLLIGWRAIKSMGSGMVRRHK